MRLHDYPLSLFRPLASELRLRDELAHLLVLAPGGVQHVRHCHTPAIAGGQNGRGQDSGRARLCIGISNALFGKW